MIKAIVIEDEIRNLDELSGLIDNTGFMKVVGKYACPFEALRDAKSVCPQVAFIDIDLPEMDGLTFAERLLEMQPAVNLVFVTGFNQYAVKAFEINALDYILKPIRIERFRLMAERINNKINRPGYAGTSGVSINLLGSMEVKIGDDLVQWKRSKAEEVFAFLVVNHGCFIRKELIVDTMWPEYEFTNALSILKTTVCRIRNIFSGSDDDIKIVFSGGSYCLNIGNGVSCDYIELERAISGFDPENPATFAPIAHYAEKFSKGLMAQQGYLWSQEKEEETRRQLLNILEDIAKKYKSQGNKSEYLRTFRRLCELAPYLDSYQYAYLKTLEEYGEYHQIAIYIKKLEKVIRDNYDLRLSDRIAQMLNKYY